MTESQTDLLESVLAETGATIRGVEPDQLHRATPCPEYDVARMVDHLVGWATSFAARLTGDASTADPNDFHAGDDPAGEFNTAAGTIVKAYREGTEASAQLPVGVLLMEFVTHGWDLATATGQSFGIDPAAADAALQAGRQMLKPEYRGSGQSFGYEVEVDGSAGPMERLVGFLGRDPGWRPATA